MTFAVALVLLQGPSIEKLDAMAKAKDVKGLTAAVTLPEGVANPFNVLKSGGPFETGKFGWQAQELVSPSGTQYAVIGTPLTSEDVGEILLKRVGGKWVYIPEENHLGVHIVSHQFELSFDIPKKIAFLEDRLSFRSAGKGDWVFRMSPNYKVSDVRDSYGVPVSFRQTSGIVALPRPTGPNPTYRIRYSGVVNLPNYAGSISDQEATLVNDYWYPMVARQPSTFKLTVRPPEGWTAISNGNLESREGGVFRYSMDLPVVYFSVIAAKMNSAELEVGKDKFRAWSPRYPEEKLRIHTELMAPIVKFYRETFGIWPFNGYGAVDSPNYGGGALEAYSFATYGGWIPSEDAHEPAHTLWGGVINNTYLKSFWNESFANFSDALYHRNVPIGRVEERRQAFLTHPNVDESYSQAPVFDSGAWKGPISVTMGYGKGSFVMQMLEEWLGTESVVKAMSTWLRVQPRAVPGEWEDFERVLIAQEPDRDIKGFFDDWGRRPGFANFGANVSYQNDATIIRIAWKGPRFRMPLTVLRTYATGKQKFDTVWLDGQNDVITLDGPKPEVVSLDPWRQTIRKFDPSEATPALEAVLPKFPKVVDQEGRDWLAQYGGKPTVATADLDPAGKFLVGSPENWPLMKELCDKVGFVVTGDKLKYDGSTVDLTSGGAMAIIDLPEGKRCAIGLGKLRHRGSLGQTRLILVDRLGRFIRGTTEPKTKGWLTYRLP